MTVLETEIASSHLSAREAPRLADADTHYDVALFLAYEASLLDERRYHEWANIVSEDFTYKVPTPLTPDSPYKPPYDTRTMLIDESKWSMTTQWFRRFDEDIYEMAWGENPPVRFRHFLSNMRTELSTEPETYISRSNVMLVATRQSDAPKFVTGARVDEVRRVEGRLLLVSRWVTLDQSVIDFPQLRIML